MIVYIDEIFFVNLLMDGLVLWMTAKLLQRTVTVSKLLIAALVGALYGVLIYFPGFIWLSNGFVKAACAMAMIWICFGRSRWQSFIKTLVYFYLVSFAFGGGTVAFMYFCGEWIIQTWNGIALVQVDFKIFWLIAAGVLLVIMMQLLHKSLHVKLEQCLSIVAVLVELRGRSVRLQLLVDSGNCLTDPITGKTVAVVQTSCLQPLFTAEEYMQLQNTAADNSFDITQTILQLPSLAGRIRLIPFHSIGYQGLLLGVRMDRVQIDAWGVEQTDVVMALSPQYFDLDNAYQGVIAPVYDV